jgi:hypothetical protein
MLTKKEIFKERYRLNFEKLLYAIVFTLILEGLFRKLLPSAVGLLIFFLKDIYCLIGLVLVFKSFSINNIRNNPFYNLRKFFFIAFLPVLINTNFKDPFLALFGLKQYMLYMVVGLMVPTAFTPDKIERLKKFLFYIVLMIIPTTMVAVLQNSLPGTHWLNRSVDGGSLEAFSAGGILRVSSTFAFTGQYSWFLNIACVFLVITFCMPVNLNKFLNKKTALILKLFVCVNFIVGAFITGGRTAVLGSALVLFGGFLFSFIKTPEKILIPGLTLIIILSLSLTGLRIIKPEFFVVYDIRSSGHKTETQNDELGSRLMKDMFQWTDWVGDQDVVAFLFGNGVGVMSNGAERISDYANSVRGSITTEGDIDTTVWEGGVYLLALWYGMRFWVISKCFKFWRKIKNSNNAIAVSFLLVYIISVGVYGGLAKQPPISIWWWLTIGLLATIYNYDKHIYMLKNN